MKKVSAYSTLLTLALLTGCNSSSNDKDSQNTTPAPAEPASVTADHDGIWIAQAYGMAFQLENGTLTEYQFTQQYCQQTDQDSVTDDTLRARYWVLSEDSRTLRQIFTEYGTDWKQQQYTKADALPDACQTQLIARIDQAGYQADPTRDYEIFWQSFNEYYPAFEQRGVDWAALKNQDNITDDRSLYFAMASNITPLQDSHVEVYPIDSDDGYNVTRGPTLTHRFQEEFIAANGPIDNDEKYMAYLEYDEAQMDTINEIRLAYAPDTQLIRTAANEQMIWYTRSDNIAVLILQNMVFFRGAEDDDNLDYNAELAALNQGLSQFMADITDTRGLIIDVRGNPGGFDASSQLIARHFLDTERTLYSKQARLGSSRTEPDPVTLAPANTTYLKPVVLLTSIDSTSAAEVFTLMMRELPNVTVIGEPTQGAIADILEKQLPNGARFDMVNEYYITPDGQWFEGTGIPVDITAEYGTQEQRQNGTDHGMNIALEHLAQ